MFILSRLYTMYTVHCTVQCTVYSILYEILMYRKCNVHHVIYGIIYIVRRTLYDVYCTLYSVRRTKYVASLCLHRSLPTTIALVSPVIIRPLGYRPLRSPSPPLSPIVLPNYHIHHHPNHISPDATTLFLQRQLSLLTVICIPI